MAAKTVLFFLALLFVPLSGDVRAAGPSPVIPGPGKMQILTTTDGSAIIGRITRIGETEIVFETSVGSITVSRTRIRSIRTVPAGDIRNGQYWYPDPNTTRLLFAPTGRMLGKGHGYFADYYIFFPTANYGITDRISLGGGMSIFPTGRLRDQLYFFTPKIGIRQSGRINFAAGALIISFPDFDDDDNDGDEDEDEVPFMKVVYGVGTWGGPDRSVTLGLGYGMVDDDLAERPLVVLGGEYRLSRRMAFVSENWIVPGIDNALISYGLRIFNESLSVDLALLNAVGADADPVFPGVPYVDFVWNF